MSVTTFGIIILLFAAYSTDVFGVKITNLKIPEYFTISEESADHVILDCEYQLEENETGLVVKWQKNGLNIYQWIYGGKPTALPHMKGRINESYEASPEDTQKYRALVLTNPSTDATGDYKCLVTVKQTADSKSGHLEIIDFRNSSLNVSHKAVDDDIQVTCEAQNVFPKPTLQIALNREDNIPIIAQEMELEEDGYFDASITGTIRSSNIDDNSVFWCFLSFEGTNYTANTSVPFSGDSSLHSSTLNLVVAFTVIAPLLFSGVSSI